MMIIGPRIYGQSRNVKLGNTLVVFEWYFLARCGIKLLRGMAIEGSTA
jgi:hypothetical protein